MIRVKAQIQPTEDPEKVKKAITNLFGDISLNIEEDLISGRLTEITQLRELRSRIAQDRIKATLNKTLTRWIKDDYLSFGLNRQAAYAGHVSLNLTNEDPMGPIQVQIRRNATEIVEYLTK